MMILHTNRKSVTARTDNKNLNVLMIAFLHMRIMGDLRCSVHWLFGEEIAFGSELALTGFRTYALMFVNGITQRALQKPIKYQKLYIPNQLQSALDLAKEKGASTWLTALPLAEHGFTLHKGAFRDDLALRYGWTPADMPSKCACAWEQFLRGARYVLCQGWIPLNQAQ